MILLGPGPCSLVNQQVVQFLQEAEEIITVSNSSHFPLGYSFLLANSLQLTQSELLHRIESFKSGVSFSDILQSSSDYAVRLAAHTSRLECSNILNPSLIHYFFPTLPNKDPCSRFKIYIQLCLLSVFSAWHEDAWKVFMPSKHQSVFILENIL